MDVLYGGAERVEFYVGLSSTQPNAAGGGVTEPSGMGYARAKINGFTAASNGTVKNKSEILFSRSTGVWFPPEKKAAYWVVFDGTGSGAHVLSFGPLKTAVNIWSSTDVKIGAEQITVTLRDDG